MKRIFDKPLPRTYGDFKHFQARQQAADQSANVPHWIIAIAFAGGFSVLLVGIMILGFLFSILTGNTTSSLWEKVESPMLLSLAISFGSGCILLVWNRFFANK
jgi:hypothetical protein